MGGVAGFDVPARGVRGLAERGVVARGVAGLRGARGDAPGAAVGSVLEASVSLVGLTAVGATIRSPYAGAGSVTGSLSTAENAGVVVAEEDVLASLMGVRGSDDCDPDPVSVSALD